MRKTVNILSRAKHLIKKGQYKQCLEILEGIDAKGYETEIEFRKGCCYFKLGDIPKTEEHFKKSTSREKTFHSFKSNTNLASIYKRKPGKDNKRQAFDFLIEAVDICDELNLSIEKEDTYKKFARYLIELDFFDEFDEKKLCVDWSSFYQAYFSTPQCNFEENMSGYVSLITSHIFYSKDQNFAKASELLDEAIGIFSDVPDMLRSITKLQNNYLKRFENTAKREYISKKLKQDRSDLKRLYNISQALCSVLNLDKLLMLIMDSVIEVLKAERGFLMLKGRTGELEFRVARNYHKEDLSPDDFMISSTIVDEVVETEESVLIADIENEQDFEKSSSILELNLKSVMGVPLKIGDNFLGVIYVDNSITRNNFGVRELNLLTTLAAQATIAIENADLLSNLQEEKSRLETLLICTKEMMKASDYLTAIEIAAEYILSIIPYGDKTDLYAYLFKRNENICYTWDKNQFIVHEHCSHQFPDPEQLRDITIMDNTIFIPIWHGSKLFTVIFFKDSFSNFTFKPEEKNFIYGISNSLSLILHKIHRDQEKKLTLIGKMASSMMHDLKTPMTTVRGYADLMIGGKQREETERKKFLSTMITCIDYMNEMIADILDFAKGEYKLDLDFHPVEPYIRTIVSIPQKKFTVENIDIDLRFDYTGMVYLDGHRFQRVVINLIKNSIDAIDEQGNIIIHIYDTEEEIVFKFIDDGCGVPKKVKSTLFEPFVTSGKQYGTGLGLAIVKSIIDEHKGKIEYNDLEKGTEFIVKLPKEQEKGKYDTEL